MCVYVYICAYLFIYLGIWTSLTTIWIHVTIPGAAVILAVPQPASHWFRRSGHEPGLRRFGAC